MSLLVLCTVLLLYRCDKCTVGPARISTKSAASDHIGRIRSGSKRSVTCRIITVVYAYIVQ